MPPCAKPLACIALLAAASCPIGAAGAAKLTYLSRTCGQGSCAYEGATAGLVPFSIGELQVPQFDPSLGRFQQASFEFYAYSESAYVFWNSSPAVATFNVDRITAFSLGGFAGPVGRLFATELGPGYTVAANVLQTLSLANVPINDNRFGRFFVFADGPDFGIDLFGTGFLSAPVSARTSFGLSPLPPGVSAIAATLGWDTMSVSNSYEPASTVPAPCTFAILGIGARALKARRRRRQG